MTSVVSLRAFANSSNVPIAVFVDMQQEYLAKLRPLAISEINRAMPCDASATHARDDVSADEIHRAVSKISGLYGEVYETTEWIDATLPRKLGIGKNAGG